MFCRNCGAEIRDGSKFCSECGAAQQDVASPHNTGTRNHIPPVNQLNQVTVQKAPYNMMCIIGLILVAFLAFIQSLCSFEYGRNHRICHWPYDLSAEKRTRKSPCDSRYCNQSFFHALCRDCTFSLHITLKQKIPCFAATPELSFFRKTNGGSAVTLPPFIFLFTAASRPGGRCGSVPASDGARSATPVPAPAAGGGTPAG